MVGVNGGDLRRVSGLVVTTQPLSEYTARTGRHLKCVDGMVASASHQVGAPGLRASAEYHPCWAQLGRGIRKTRRTGGLSARTSRQVSGARLKRMPVVCGRRRGLKLVLHGCRCEGRTGVGPHPSHTGPEAREAHTSGDQLSRAGRLNTTEGKRWHEQG